MQQKAGGASVRLSVVGGCYGNARRAQRQTDSKQWEQERGKEGNFGNCPASLANRLLLLSLGSCFKLPSTANWLRRHGCSSQAVSDGPRDAAQKFNGRLIARLLLFVPLSFSCFIIVSWNWTPAQWTPLSQSRRC